MRKALEEQQTRFIWHLLDTLVCDWVWSILRIEQINLYYIGNSQRIVEHMKGLYDFGYRRSEVGSSRPDHKKFIGHLNDQANELLPQFYVRFPRSAKNKPPTHKNTCKLSYSKTSIKLSGSAIQITPVAMEQIVIPENRVSMSPNSGRRVLATIIPPISRPNPAPNSP